MPLGSVVGNGEGEVGLPAGVVEIVVVEVDRAVLLRGVGEVAFVARPVGAGHRPGGEIDCRAVERVGRAVDRPG